MNKLIPTLAILSLMLATSVLSYNYCLWTRPILPTAARQRRLCEYGYLEYEGIDGICGPKTHFAQDLYERKWSAIKAWKARQK